MKHSERSSVGCENSMEIINEVPLLVLSRSSVGGTGSPVIEIWYICTYKMSVSLIRVGQRNLPSASVRTEAEGFLLKEMEL